MAAAVAGSSVIDIFELENDTVFTVDGAVCDDTGLLNTPFYKGHVDAFKDLEIVRSTIQRGLAAPAGTPEVAPGMRLGEERPSGLTTWDDTRNGRKTIEDGDWGAGWKASHPNPAAQTEAANGLKTKAAKWFNIRQWGSWRYSFLLAKLQREVWQSRCPPAASSTPAAKGRKKESMDDLLLQRSERKRSRKVGAKLEQFAPDQQEPNVPKVTLDSFFKTVPKKEQQEAVVKTEQRTLHHYSFGRKGEVKLI